MVNLNNIKSFKFLLHVHIVFMVVVEKLQHENLCVCAVYILLVVVSMVCEVKYFTTIFLTLLLPSRKPSSFKMYLNFIFHPIPCTTLSHSMKEGAQYIQRFCWKGNGHSGKNCTDNEIRIFSNTWSNSDDGMVWSVWFFG